MILDKNSKLIYYDVHHFIVARNFSGYDFYTSVVVALEVNFVTTELYVRKRLVRRDSFRKIDGSIETLRFHSPFSLVRHRLKLQRK